MQIDDPTGEQLLALLKEYLRVWGDLPPTWAHVKKLLYLG